ncbi:MAG: dTDP-4-dehydrorhamnose 3,5-epimerase [Proteobacteria bacterium]|nr:dTDP-4-dehydrorhamnose 3,5-epimerase [Pseudomonadota bacterium]
MPAQIDRLAIPDVLLITPKVFGDARGAFAETYSRRELAEAGFNGVFVQDNHSRSPQKGTVRGLHFQLPPHAQDKLLRVTRGAILDVAVDLRPGSPTRGRHVAVELSADNWRQLLVPKGFAHGFQTLTDDCEVLYKVTDYYTPAAERGLLWSDPALGLDWPIGPDQAVINARDAAWPGLAELGEPFASASGAP